MQIISHPLYLAPIPLYAQLYASQGMLLDADSSFIKQTFRNRAIIATENGAQALTIPVVHNYLQSIRDVRISEHGNWRHRHWNAIQSAYRKSPFFDYYADDFAHFYEEKDGFLLDFNMRLHNVVCELLGLERECKIFEKTSEKSKENNFIDLRPMASVQEMEKGDYPNCQPYYQVFAQRNGFIPNLSIIDLLFNMGPEGLLVLRDAKIATE